MKLSLGNKFALIFFMLIIISIVNLVVFINNKENTDTQHMWVLHTHAVIAESESLLGSLRDAETGQRGYLLTRDKSYLEPYNKGVDGSLKTLYKLKALISDNPKQQSLLVEVEQNINDKFLELKSTIQLM